MTKLDRLLQQKEELQKHVKVAVQRNNFSWLSMIHAKMEQIDKEIAQARRFYPTKLSEALSEYNDETKNEIYKSLIKISLAADYVNECVENAKETLKSVQIKNFSLRSDAEELCKLSQKIASFVLLPNQRLLEEMIVDNSDFIDACDSAADKHLKEKLNL